MKLTVFTLITGSLLVVSCNKTDVTPIQNPDELSFSKSIQPLAASKCVDCHDATTQIQVSTFNDWTLLDQAGKLRPAILEGTHVYIENDLSVEERELVEAWIEAGYPE
jgi:hypothetical protein